MSKVYSLMIGFPHGMGDFICLTPALKSIRKQLEDSQIMIITLPKLKNAELLKNCPYIDEHHTFGVDLWEEVNLAKEGTKEEKTIANQCYQHNYKIWLNYISKKGLWHKAAPTLIKFSDVTFKRHKVDIVYDEFQIPNVGTQTEVFISDEERQMAKRFIPKVPYVFVARNSTDKSRVMPNEVYASEITTKKPVIFAGKERNINIEFEIMRNADKVIVTNSVFMHAADAMNKKIDVLFLGKYLNGRLGYNRIRPRNTEVVKIVEEK